MTFADLIRKYGDSDASIARALGTSRQLVKHWRDHGIKPQRQAWIQVQTKGRLRADKPEEHDAP
jgi:hypothetical protein